MDALHPKREPQQSEQKSPAIADEQKQSTPHQEEECSSSRTSSPVEQRHQKVKLTDVNSSLTCDLCKGYLIDATTISECLHSFCRSCIIKFLEENSFCPVCEVIINKAKPNLKLDKTLQDIVYKLVPGLFLSEMTRRRRFYAERPAEAGKVSPEQRGEDTERTIFNPQDKISLSLEYIGDAAHTDLILKDLKQRQELASNDAQVESLLKRYLQCPAMCRVDVIKKFIRNKYNVDTDLFQIDILYKRVPLPLPDHYTLVDVAYIYTWKRNEPMRFYFRIIDKGNDELPDLTKVFTPTEDAPFLHQPLALSTPHRLTRGSPASTTKDKNRKTPKRRVARQLSVAKPTKKEKKDNSICDKRNEEGETKRKRYVSEMEEEEEAVVKCSGGNRKLPKTENDRPIVHQGNVKNDQCDETSDAGKSETDIETKPDTVRIKKETETAVGSCDNGKVYTNITLNRTNNVEIVTKIQRLSDKEGQQIEVNVIDKSAKQKCDNKGAKDDQVASTTSNSTSEDVEIKTEVKTNNSTYSGSPPIIKEELPTPSNDSLQIKPEASLPKREPIQESTSPEVSSTTNDTPTVDEELERTKFEFLKSIELTSKKAVDNIARMVHQQQKNNVSSTASTTRIPQNQPGSQSISMPTNTKVEATKPNQPTSTTKQGSSGVKRKNSSPTKNESKRAKSEQKRTTKIILQQKPGYPPLNLTNKTGTSKMPEELIKQNRNELRSLFQTCRLNIPASLSITLKENGETSRQPVQMPPVQNFIEILKIDDKEGTKKITLSRDEALTKNLDVRNLPVPDTELKMKETSSTNCGTTSQLPNIAPPLLNTLKHQAELMNKVPKEAKEALTMTQKDPQSFQKIFEESIKKNGSSMTPLEVPNGSGKKKISEIAQELYKKTKNEQDTKKNLVKQPMPSPTPSAATSSTSSSVTPPITVPNVQKIAIPRLNNQRVVKPPKRNQKYENATHQTLANLHSSSLGLNYTVSVGKQSRDLLKQPYMSNGIMTPQSGVHGNARNTTSPASPLEQGKSTLGYLSQAPPISPKTTEVKGGHSSPKNLKVTHSPKPSIASPAPKTEQGSLPPPQSFSPRSFPSQPSPKPRSTNPSPKPRCSSSSPKPKTSNSSPKPKSNASPNSSTSSSYPSAVTPALTANELLEKYNIQNLAQLSASMNFNASTVPQAYLNTMSGKQMTALHQAMLMNQLHNRQNWFNINQAPLLQYEKYLQNLNATKNQIMGNLKDN